MADSVRAGLFRHDVNVQRPTSGGEDEYGGAIPGVPIVLARTHGEVAPLTGREFFEAQQIAAEVTQRVRLRWQPELRDLKPKDQIIFEGRVLDIAYVGNLDHRNRQFEVLCRELV